MAELRGEDLHQKWWQQLVDLQPPLQRLLLPGITDPVQSGTLRQVWSGSLSSSFSSSTPPSFDVISIVVGWPPQHAWPLLHRADAVLLVMRPSLPQMASAVPVLRTLRNQLIDHGVAPPPWAVADRAGDQPAGGHARAAQPGGRHPAERPRTAHVLTR